MADVGHRFDNWTLTERLREGGSGSIWRARDDANDRWAELKAMATFAENIESFANAVDSLSALKHPALPEMVGSGGDDEHIYAAFEELRGDTLAYKLAGGALSPSTAIATFQAIADALAKAHELGVPHGHLSAKQIVFTDKGVKLKGLALNLDDHRDPEVVMAGDVFELGVLLHEALTAKEVDRKSSTLVVLDPGERVHPALRAVVLKATHVDQDKQFETMGEFAELLRTASVEGAGSAVGAAVRGRGRGVLIALLLVLLGLAGGAALVGTVGVAGVMALVAPDEQPTNRARPPSPDLEAPDDGTTEAPDATDPAAPPPPPPPPEVVEVEEVTWTPPPEEPPADDEPTDGSLIAVSFYSAPEGATVYVDDVKLGITPIRRHLVPPGRIRVRMERSDGTAAKDSLRIQKQGGYVRFVWRGGKTIEGF